LGDNARSKGEMRRNGPASQFLLSRPLPKGPRGESQPSSGIGILSTHTTQEDLKKGTSEKSHKKIQGKKGMEEHLFLILRMVRGLATCITYVLRKKRKLRAERLVPGLGSNIQL